MIRFEVFYACVHRRLWLGIAASVGSYRRFGLLNVLMQLLRRIHRKDQCTNDKTSTTNLPADYFLPFFFLIFDGIINNL